MEEWGKEKWEEENLCYTWSRKRDFGVPFPAWPKAGSLTKKTVLAGKERGQNDPSPHPFHRRGLTFRNMAGGGGEASFCTRTEGGHI